MSSEAESWTLEERTLQKIQHSNTLCKRLSYICSVDMATKEVAELLSTDFLGPMNSFLLCAQRAQLLPLLGQRIEVLSYNQPVNYAALDGLIDRYKRPLPTTESFGLFPALEVFDSSVSNANCSLVPCGDAIAVLASAVWHGVAAQCLTCPRSLQQRSFKVSNNFCCQRFKNDANCFDMVWLCLTMFDLFLRARG